MGIPYANSVVKSISHPLATHKRAADTRHSPPPVLILVSDLFEHLDQYGRLSTTTTSNGDETIAGVGGNKRTCRQYHHQRWWCHENSNNDGVGGRRANCEPTGAIGPAGWRELYPASDSHYGLIVPIQQIPSGSAAAAERRAPMAQSSRLRGAHHQHRTEIGNAGTTRACGGGRLPTAPQSPCVNDNREATDKSRESRSNASVAAATTTTATTTTASVFGDYYLGNPLSVISQQRGSSWRRKAEPGEIGGANQIKPCLCNNPPAPIAESLSQLDRWRSKWSLSIIGAAYAIRLQRLEAPQSIQAGQQLKLRCLYETRGDKLQSLAWYRNGREFYRYQPFERRGQSVLAFNSTGVHVDLTKSRNNTVYLTNTTLETSGRYRCEATGTTFQEAKLETYIEVRPTSSSSATSWTHHKWSLVLISINALTHIASLTLSHINHQIKL